MATTPPNSAESSSTAVTKPEKPPPPDPNASQSEPYSEFSSKTRTYLTYLLGIVMTLSTLTATIYFPLLPMLSTQFHVSAQAINLSVTVYATAQALSPALFASLADSLGRRPVLLGLVALYTAASLGLALNRDNYAALLVLRALQSLGGSPLPALAYGFVADLAVPAERGSLLGPMLSTCNAVSAVGPVIGGAVALGTEGVVWVFLTLLIIAVVCLALVGFTLPETARSIVGNGSRPAVGVYRTWWSMLRKKTSSVAGKGYSSKASAAQRWRPANAFGSFRNILYKDAALVLWVVASSYSVYYTFQVALPSIFADVYEYNELEIGLVFLPGLAGITVGGIIAGKLVDRNYGITAKESGFEVGGKEYHGLGDFPIEAARYRHCIGFVVLMTVLVTGYGWAVYFRVHPSVPIILQGLICCLSTLLSHTASALLVDIFPDGSSSAYASGQIMRCGLSAASAAALQPLVDAVGRGWYFTIFALFVGVTGSLSIIISRWKGMKWRQRRCIHRPVDRLNDSPLVTSEALRPVTRSSAV